MTNKQPQSLQHARLKKWPQSQLPETGGIAVKASDDVGPRASARDLWREVPLTYETLLWPPALRKLLESDHYQVAFLARRENHNIETEPYPAEAQAALFPFSWKEFIAKVCESVRNAYSVSPEAVAGFADVRINFGKMEVTRAGEPVKLTAQEFKALKFLMQNAERVISREELLNEAWGYQNYPSTRTVDNHILKLRQKLESDPARPSHFLTIPRSGYKFVP